MSEHRAMNLAAAREHTPPVNPVEAMRRSLAVAVFGAVKEGDVVAMVEKLKEQAMGGDQKAMKMYFELIGVMGKQQPPPPAPPPPPDNGGMRQMAEALHDLVDEIRVARAAPPAAKPRRLVNGNGAHDED